MTISTETIVRDLQTDRAFRDVADGDEPLRQRIVALASVRAELALDPQNPRLIEEAAILKAICVEYYMAPVYEGGVLTLDPDKLRAIELDVRQRTTD